ncbi:MAG: diaminopimelate epimerase [Pseudomonadota bacterium]|nr:diaminopimelate epimerase [Pseudomonadota bacterium]
MRIDFTKMHGLGNDFMVIDLVTQRMSLSPELIRQLADRHFGIGFDQMLIVEPPDQPDVDFRYRIFNADGSEVEQCGNGVRCFARFVHERRLTKKKKIRVSTNSGIVEPEINAEGWVRVNMGYPRTEPALIPFLTAQSADLYQVQVNEQMVELDVVNMGNPHTVLWVDDVKTAPVASLGAALESHAQFPQRVNVGFMQVLNRREINLRVFERGTGETLACGTGACAAVVSGVRRGLLDAGEEIRVHLAGGDLLIQWQAGQVVWMTGPTASVYEGVINPNELPTRQ